MDLCLLSNLRRFQLVFLQICFLLHVWQMYCLDSHTIHASLPNSVPQTKPIRLICFSLFFFLPVPHTQTSTHPIIKFSLSYACSNMLLNHFSVYFNIVHFSFKMSFWFLFIISLYCYSHFIHMMFSCFHPCLFLALWTSLTKVS